MKSAQHCFNKAAKSYDSHAEIQKAIGLELISKVRDYYLCEGNLIDLGCGTGLITEQLAVVSDYQKFYALDIAEEMLEVAKPRLTKYQIELHQQDIQSFNYKNLKFDFAFANMSLHWTHNFARTIVNIIQQLNDKKWLAFTIPLKNNFNEINFAARNKYLSMHKIIEILNVSGFHLEFFKEKLYKKNFSSRLCALKSIKATGANFVENSFATNSYKQLKEKLREQDNGFALTYHIGFFIARKA